MSTKAVVEWARNHAGLWTCGIFIVALLGGIGGLGVWALNAQKQVVVGIVEKKETALKGEIDTTRVILERLESRVERLESRVDMGFQRMDKRLDILEADLKLILQRLPK